MTRRSLQARRAQQTFDVTHLGQTYSVSTGLYRDGSVGEVFVQAHKISSEVEALARDAAILISLALQHGCAVDTMRHAITRNGDGSASTLVGAVLDEISNSPSVGPADGVHSEGKGKPKSCR